MSTDLLTDSTWARVPVTPIAKFSLWRTEWSRYTLFSEKLWELGEQLPGCYGDQQPHSLSYDNRDRLKQEAWEKFQAMDMFFVKASRNTKILFLLSPQVILTNQASGL